MMRKRFSHPKGSLVISNMWYVLRPIMTEHYWQGVCLGHSRTTLVVTTRTHISKMSFTCRATWATWPSCPSCISGSSSSSTVNLAKLSGFTWPSHWTWPSIGSLLASTLSSILYNNAYSQYIRKNYYMSIVLYILHNSDYKVSFM